MAETLSTLSIISFVIAAVLLAVAVFLWFFFKIPSVIGDLSGRTARKSIAQMRAANEKTGAKAYKVSKNNAERGKLTETMHGIEKKQETASQKKAAPKKSGPLVREPAAADETAPLEEETAKLLQEEERTGPLGDMLTEPLLNQDTARLIDEDITALLCEEETGKLTTEAPTELLTEKVSVSEGETELLAKPCPAKKLTIVEEVILIHTDESI